ncbi:MAG: hypothetical protein JSU05_15925, partial [Bacteroidetes bacterium]|nr:hypothetical protein [Bacteroidota bacterium]
GEFEKIGNTIMWISQGIDSGNVIGSECTHFTKWGDLNEIQWQVMEHAHDLYLRTIEYLLKATPPYPAIPQNEIAEGKLYLTKMWGFRNKRKLLQNLASFSGITSGEQLVTIPLPQQKIPD